MYIHNIVYTILCALYYGNIIDLRTQQQKAASSHFLEDMLAPQFMHPSHREEGQR